MYEYKKIYTIDFTSVKYYLEVHQIIKEALCFPDYYGCNWSAFWDCLTEMEGDSIHIVIIGIDVIREKFDGTADKIIEIMKRFKNFIENYCDDILIEIVDGDTRTVIE